MTPTPNDELQKAIEEAESIKGYANTYPVHAKVLGILISAAKRTLAAERERDSIKRETIKECARSSTFRQIREQQVVIDELEQERDSLRSQLALANDAAAKGEAGRELLTPYEKCQKEIERLHKELVNANRGAETNALINNSLVDENKQLRADLEKCAVTLHEAWLYDHSVHIPLKIQQALNLPSIQSILNKGVRE